MAGTSSLQRQRTVGKAGCAGCDKATDAPPANWREPWTSDGPRTLVHTTTRSTRSSPVASSRSTRARTAPGYSSRLATPAPHSNRSLASASASEREPDGVRTRPQGLRTQRNRAVVAESARRFLRPASRGAARKRRSGSNQKSSTLSGRAVDRTTWENLSTPVRPASEFPANRLLRTPLESWTLTTQLYRPGADPSSTRSTSSAVARTEIPITRYRILSKQQPPDSSAHANQQSDGLQKQCGV